MPHYDMIEGDVGTNVDIVLEDEKGTLELIAGDQVDYLWWFEDEDPIRRFPAVTIVDEGLGHVRYTTTTGDLNDSGVLKVQAQLLRGANTWTTHPQIYQIGPLGT